MLKNLFATHPIQASPHVDAGELSTTPATARSRLKRALTAKHLVMLGIGAVIGAGIFVLTGQAAAVHAGPAVVLSFVGAGIACTFAGLCYAEFSSMLPVSGSAYSYSYATLGEFVAWFIGWMLVLEYLFAHRQSRSAGRAISTVMLTSFGVGLPAAISTAPLTLMGGSFHATGALINLPAVLIVGAISCCVTSASRNRRRSTPSSSRSSWW